MIFSVLRLEDEDRKQLFRNREEALPLLGTN